MYECRLTSLASLFCAFGGRGDGKQGEGVPFMGRGVGLGFLWSLAKLGDESRAHGSVLSITLWLQLLILPLFFRVCFRAVAIFSLAYHMSQFFLVSEMAGKGYTPLRQPWSFISSQASKVLALLFSNIEGREFAPRDSLLIAIRFLVIAIALRRKIRSTWATLQFSIIVPKPFIEIQWGSKESHLSQSCLISE